MKEINFINKEEMDFIIQSKFISSFPGLNESFHQPRYSINDLDVTHRDATYWDKKDILPTVQSKINTRRRYTLKQAVWIKLIQQLRDFDISLNKIKAIKESILGQEANAFELFQDPNVQKVIEQIAEHSGHLEMYKELLGDVTFQDALKEGSIDIFETMILYTIVFRRDVSYIVDVNNECFPYCFDKHHLFVEEFGDFEERMRSPHIVLSISNAVSQLIQDWMKKEWTGDASFLTKAEKKILKLLRDERTEELQIFKKDNNPERVIQVSTNNTTAIKDFSNYIVRNGYQKITVSTRQGKIVNFKNEISLKLNN
ncbi:MAG: MerR family transcriptional regulator [Flavobacteriia bacterium]|jgi:DNA-binding transcriptional MerR regulator